MGKFLDLIGKKFGRWTVIKQDKNNNSNRIKWWCICDCQVNEENPTLKLVNGNSLRNGTSKSCGCLHKEILSSMNLTDMVGKRFGRLVVLEIDKHSSSKRKKWICQCDCGSETKSIRGDSLRNGAVVSCGCYNKEIVSKLSKIYNKKYNTYDLTREYGIGYTLKGEEFYFDLEDYDKIKNHCWHKNKYGYILTAIVNNNLLLHRYIMNTDDNMDVDHINHIKHDNRKNNLRNCTRSQNEMNKTLLPNNTSGVTGVFWNNSKQKWQSSIQISNKKIILGRYINFDEAVKVRKDAEEKYFKEYSYNNSITNSIAFLPNSTNNKI